MRTITTEKKPIKMWLEYLEDGAEKQAKAVANLPYLFKWLAIMPDAHQGYGMPIGGVMATNGVIVPNAVGVDIGCGMLAVKTTLTELPEEEIKKLFEFVREAIPMGFHWHGDKQEWQGFNVAPDSEIIQRELHNAPRQLGTLGGGNHFIEIQKGSDGHVWIMLHSGSRNIGNKVARFYHAVAIEENERLNVGIPNDLAGLPMSSPMGREYESAMLWCQAFALANRNHMANKIMELLGLATGATQIGPFYNKHHNFAVTEEHYGKQVIVHRKGATSAGEGETGIIPGSMGTNSYIVTGLGNKESFNSCSHGAGRTMGRGDAKRKLSLEVEQARMQGIVHGIRGEGNLDEAPGAYKDIDVVMSNQADLVTPVITLKPIGNIKA